MDIIVSTLISTTEDHHEDEDGEGEDHHSGEDESHNDEHGHHDHDHEHGHGADIDVIIISIVDLCIAILCILIIVHFVKYLKNNRHLTKEIATGLFYKVDIICLGAICLYTIIVFVLITHDILHFVELDASFHFELGITQWILFFIARTWLQGIFLVKLYAVFAGSALNYSLKVFMVFGIFLFVLFAYGMYLSIFMWLNHEILSPLSHDFGQVLGFVFADFLLIMVIAFMFVRKLFNLMLTLSRSSMDDHEVDENNEPLMNAIAKYSLLTTIISIVVILQFIALFLISVYYVDEEEVHVEYLQHCISTFTIFIDTMCLYFSCKVAKTPYGVVCKYPHQCYVKLCQICLGVKDAKEKKMRIELKKIKSNSHQTTSSSISPSAQSTTSTVSTA